MRDQGRVVKHKQIPITYLYYLALCAILFTSCKQETGCSMAHTFQHNVLIPHTPIKNQGRDQTCWAYAMLSTMESNNIAQGDSMELSINYAVRHLIEEHYTHHYLSQGQSHFTTRATAQTLLNLIEKYGIVPHKSLQKGSRPCSNWYRRESRKTNPTIAKLVGRKFGSSATNNIV